MSDKFSNVPNFSDEAKRGPSEDVKMFAAAALIGLCSSRGGARMSDCVREEITDFAWKLGIAMAKGPK